MESLPTSAQFVYKNKENFDMSQAVKLIKWRSENAAFKRAQNPSEMDFQLRIGSLHTQ